MDFIVNNQELFITIGLIICVLGTGLFFVPWLKRNNYIDQQSTDFTQELLELMKLLMYELNLKDETKEHAMNFFRIAEIAVDYVDANLDLQGRKIEEVSYEKVLELLNELGIELTDQRKRLIEMGIQYAVDKLGKIE